MTDLSPEARALLREGRAAFSPDARQLAQVREALLSKVAAGAEAPASSLASRGWLGVALKLTAIATIAVTASVALYLALLPRSTPNSTLVPVAHAPQSEPLRAEAGGQAGAIERSARGTQPSAASALEHDTDRSQARQPRSKLPARAHAQRTARHAAVARTPAAAATAAATGAAHELSGAAPAPVPSDQRAASAANPSDTLAREVALLRRARAAAESDNPELALRLCDAYAAEFPRGLLQEEALAIRALSLCALGKLPAARAVRDRLVASAPQSPHLARIRRNCPALEK